MPRPSTTSSPAFAAPTPTMRTTSTSQSMSRISRQCCSVARASATTSVRASIADTSSWPAIDGRADDVDEVRPFGIDDVVLPVGLENPSVVVEVALVGGEAVGALENGEEIRQQVDQHSTGRGRAARESCDHVARSDAE